MRGLSGRMRSGRSFCSRCWPLGMKLGNPKGRAPVSSCAFVELMTPQCKVFSGYAAAVTFSPVSALIELEPNGFFFLGQIGFCKLTLRVGSHFHFFAIHRAAASIRNRRLMIVAEAIERVGATSEVSPPNEGQENET